MCTNLPVACKVGMNLPVTCKMGTDKPVAFQIVTNSRKCLLGGPVAREGDGLLTG